MPLKILDPIDLLAQIISSGALELKSGPLLFRNSQKFVKGNTTIAIELNIGAAIALERHAREYRDFYRAADRVATAFKNSWPPSQLKEAQDIMGHIQVRLMQTFGTISDDPVTMRGK